MSMFQAYQLVVVRPSDYDYPALTATIPSLETLHACMLLSSPENATVS